MRTPETRTGRAREEARPVRSGGAVLRSALVAAAAGRRELARGERTALLAGGDGRLLRSGRRRLRLTEQQDEPGRDERHAGADPVRAGVAERVDHDRAEADADDRRGELRAVDD